MSDLYWIYSFLQAFWSVVIVSCAQPTNWEHCFPANQWLVPWVHDAIHLAEDGAYHTEKAALKECPE